MKVDLFNVSQITDALKHAVLSTLRIATDLGVFHEKVFGYGRCLLNSFRLPCLRLMFKGHKDPVAALPIASGTSYITNPAHAIVTRVLQPILVECKPVASSS